jgi:N,N'-diacetyllegionaminate synthase
MRTIIAEFCQNHKGDLNLLKEMVWAAAEAGATYAKVQSMQAEELTYREQFEEGSWDGERMTAIKRPYQPEYERLKPMDLSDEAHWAFGGECEKAGIKPLTTVFTRSRLPFIAGLGWDAIKVASYDCASYPLIRELRVEVEKGKFQNLFISTGATYEEEIATTAGLLEGINYSFLHAVTIYPTPLSELHLGRLRILSQFTPSVGFSDHTLVERDGIQASIVAMSLGADVIERHFTLLAKEDTKDGPVSIRPEELKALVQFSRKENDELRDYVEREIPDWEQMIGQDQRSLSPVELLNRDYYRGRFASRVKGEVVYNWENRPVN